MLSWLDYKNITSSVDFQRYPSTYLGRGIAKLALEIFAGSDTLKKKYLKYMH